MSSLFVADGQDPPYPLLAMYANDGVYETDTTTWKTEVASLAHTLDEVNPWWMVDLQDVYCVWALRILNRSGISNYLTDLLDIDKGNKN